MADPTPSAGQEASSEPRKVEQETQLATNPKGTEDSTAPASDAQSTGAQGTDAQSAVSKATEAASSAATGVKDSVFSMFGGGAKKEKKVEENDADEPSGSSKAKKADDDGVGWTRTILHQACG